jgi:hypothetical protein
MIRTHSLSGTASGLLVFLLFALPRVGAAEYFIDTFDDGDAQDAMPAVWLPGGSPGGKREVVDGWLVHESGGVNMSTYVRECLDNLECHYDDVSLRTSFRVDSGRLTDVTLFARSLSSPNGTLYGGVDTSGNAILAMNIDAEVVFLEQVPTGLDPITQEISLQFDVYESQMSVWAWPTGEARPESPSAGAIVPDRFPNDTGWVGFLYRPSGAGTVSFDYFESAAAVPEPCSSVALLLGSLALFACRRK